MPSGGPEPSAPIEEPPPQTAQKASETARGTLSVMSSPFLTSSLTAGTPTLACLSQNGTATGRAPGHGWVMTTPRPSRPHKGE